MKKIILILGLLIVGNVFCVCEGASKYKIIISTKTNEISYRIIGSQKYEICADTASAPIITISSYTINIENMSIDSIVLPPSDENNRYQMFVDSAYYVSGAIENANKLDDHDSTHFVDTCTAQNVAGNKTFIGDNNFTGGFGTNYRTYQLIYSTNIGVAVSTISITGLSGQSNYYLELQKSSTTVAEWSLYINNDRDYMHYTRYSWSPAGGAGGDGSALLYSTVNNFSNADVHIYLTGGKVSYQSNSHRNFPADNYLQVLYGYYETNVTDITQIDIACDAYGNGIGIGSRIRLYGLR